MPAAQRKRNRGRSRPNAWRTTSAKSRRKGWNDSSIPWCNCWLVGDGSQENCWLPWMEAKSPPRKAMRESASSNRHSIPEGERAKGTGHGRVLPVWAESPGADRGANALAGGHETRADPGLRGKGADPTFRAGVAESGNAWED